VPTLAEEIRKATIAKLLQEKMQGATKYDIESRPQGYSDEVARDVPADYTYPANGVYGDLNWGKKVASDMSKYPMKVTRNVPTYTDANIQKTETPVDLTDPSKLAELSAIVAGQGDKPQNYGLPSLGEAAELPSKIAKNKQEQKHYFKSLDHVPAIMTQFGLPYDENASPIENWNTAIKQADPDTKAKLMQAFKVGSEQQETGTQKDIKYIANLFNISEQEAFDKVKQTMHKPREAYVAEAYKSAIAGYRTEVDAQKIAADAGKFYDALYGNQSAKKQVVNSPGNTGNNQSELVIKSKSGKPMKKDPTSPTGWSYIQ
jgi:hypothetical protein